ncbi:MAG: hypothetical protein H6Q17_527 [Bacteroidetes bacterium]|nr:hypothetical protein [Bacteroidota bacterium]
MEATTVKDRLIQFLKYKHISQAKFALSVGLSGGFVNSIRKSILPNTLSRIAVQYPDLNTGWLITGEGGMLKELEDSAHAVSDLQFLNIPFVPIHAQAGYGRGYGDLEYIKTLPTFPVIVDKTYRGKYRVIEVEGDSMDDGSRNALCDGDKILCREVKPDDWKSKLNYKDWFFVIVYKNDGIVVKQIIDHDVENGIIKCHPLNPIFDDFEVNLRDVAELFNVIKIVERNARI